MEGDGDLGGKGLVFSVGGERFAVPADWVAEVVGLVGVTTLPGAPAFCPGVFLLRGEVIPLVDLRAMLGTSPAKVSRAVVARIPGGVLGFGADRVSGVVPLEGVRVPIRGEPPGCYLFPPGEDASPQAILVDALGVHRFLAQR